MGKDERIKRNRKMNRSIAAYCDEDVASVFKLRAEQQKQNMLDVLESDKIIKYDEEQSNITNKDKVTTQKRKSFGLYPFIKR